MSDGLRIRRAAKALLLAGRSQVLLVRFEFPAGTVWALPGGGLEDGEDHVTALHRELAEELGLVDPLIGPHIWTRRQIIPFPDRRWDGQEEHIHLLEVAERFEPQPHLSWAQLRQEYIAELRWWPIDTLATGDVVFAPRRLPELVAELLADGPPANPVDVGA